MIRVVIADDHHLVRQGIRALLERTSDIQVVGEAGNGQEAVELAQRTAPDVIVMDISMPGLNGIAAVQKLREVGATARAVMLSMHSSENLVRHALRSGARGYLLKRSVTEELLLAIRAASRGELYLSPAVSYILVDELLSGRSSQEADNPIELLSPRELEVLHLIAEGHTNNEMAEILRISTKTVEKHRASVMTKLKVHDLAGLMRLAFKHGLIFLEE